MKNYASFKKWLDENTEYTERTKSNIVSRLRRADKIYPVYDDPVYIFWLTQSSDFQCLNVSVKSQIRKAVKIYYDYIQCERLGEQ